MDVRTGGIAEATAAVIADADGLNAAADLAIATGHIAGITAGMRRSGVRN